MKKTYCISDVHDHLDQLQAFLNDIDEDDVVYFLGDAVDKGPYPCSCLLLLLEDPRIKALLGNHDYMMYRFLLARKEAQKDGWNWTPEMQRRGRQWLDYNYGDNTLDAFDKFDDETQRKIISYFENAKLIYPDVEVNGKHFVLVHAYPWRMVYSNIEPPTGPLTVKDAGLNDEIINDYVWERPDFPLWDKILIKGKTIITGHTMTRYITNSYHSSKPDKIYSSCKDLKRARYINIDCGLAADDNKSRLCALCLDDMSVKYY